MLNLHRKTGRDFPKSSKIRRFFSPDRQYYDVMDYDSGVCSEFELGCAPERILSRNRTDRSDAGDFATPPQVSCGGHRIESAGNHLGSPGAVCVIRRFGLQQLGVGKNDPELVVQPVKHLTQVGLRLRERRQGIRHLRSDGHAGVTHVFRVATTWLPFAELSTGTAGDRHRESAKMRMEPPAVRTYSTFPAEIQL